MDGRRIGRNDPCPCGSGRKYKKCCHGSGRYENTAMPTPRGVYGEGAALLAPPARQSPPRRYPPRHLPAVTRVSVGYTFPEPFGHAEVSYSFEAGLLVPLESGYVVPVERLQPGMRFVLDNGAVGTVTEVGQAKVWEPPPPEPDADGNYVRRVLGRIKHTGFMVLDLSFAGQTITTTPGHLFYSLDRRGWVGAEALHVGESLLNDKGERLRLDSRSRIRHGFVELYNIEVEQFHTYLVGRGPGGAALAHNGVPGPGGPGYIAKPAKVDELIQSGGMHVLDLRGSWRSAKFTQEGLVYVLRDKVTGELLKVGQTTSKKFARRFESYVTAGNRHHKDLVLDVFEVPLDKRGLVEGQIRSNLGAKPGSLRWDNQSGRLGRTGPGIPRLPVETIVTW